MSRLTVITVCWNHLEGLRATLASVEHQDWPNTQVVVVDGDSEDGTPEFLESYRSSQDYVYISEPDGGIYDAMNKGLALADGDIVVFMNAGDTFASASSVAHGMVSYKESNWRWAYGLARVIGPDLQLQSVKAFVPYRFTKLALGLATVPHQATFMELSLLSELGGFDTSIGLAADQELLMRAALTSEPYLLSDFIATFEGGGLGSARGPTEYVWDMRKARRRARVTVGGKRSIDLAATVACAGYRWGMFAQHKARRRVSRSSSKARR